MRLAGHNSSQLSYWRVEARALEQRGRGSVHRRLGKKNQFDSVLAESNAIVRLQLLAAHARAVHKRAVGALQIDDEPNIVFLYDAGMLARNQPVRENDIRVISTADHHALAIQSESLWGPSCLVPLQGSFGERRCSRAFIHENVKGIIIRPGRRALATGLARLYAERAPSGLLCRKTSSNRFVTAFVFLLNGQER